MAVRDYIEKIDRISRAAKNSPLEEIRAVLAYCVGRLHNMSGGNGDMLKAVIEWLEQGGRLMTALSTKEIRQWQTLISRRASHWVSTTEPAEVAKVD